jgi:hypothetical protein
MVNYLTKTLQKYKNFLSTKRGKNVINSSVDVSPKKIGKLGTKSKS